MQILDQSRWERKEIFDFFSRLEYPFYAVTLPVEVTPVRTFARENQVSFYYMMIWLCTKALNQVPAFRLRVRGDQVVQLDQTAFLQGEDTDSLIYFSCTPWFDFTALTNEHSLDRDDTVPRLAWGRWYEENDRLWVHLSVEVNHRLIDGLHIGQMKEVLDREIAALGRCDC